MNATALDINTMDDYKNLCAQDKPFVLMFYAPWCGACKDMKKPFDEISINHGQEIILAKVNIENTGTKRLKELFCITAIPTFICKESGMMSKEALSGMVKGHIRQPAALKALRKDANSKPVKTHPIYNKSIQ
jgi:thioredoxin-like negative regulator of GroEL